MRKMRTLVLCAASQGSVSLDRMPSGSLPLDTEQGREGGIPEGLLQKPMLSPNKQHYRKGLTVKAVRNLKKRQKGTRRKR